MPNPAPRLKPVSTPPPTRAAVLRTWSDKQLDEAERMLSEHKDGVSDSRSYTESSQARAAARTLQRTLLRARSIKTSSRVWLDPKTQRWRWALKLRED